MQASARSRSARWSRRSAALILIVSLFLDWYERLTGWTVFEIVDLVLAGLALWTIFSLAGGSAS